MTARRRMGMRYLRREEAGDICCGGTFACVEEAGAAGAQRPAGSIRKNMSLASQLRSVEGRYRVISTNQKCTQSIRVHATYVVYKVALRRVCSGELGKDGEGVRQDVLTL